MNILVISPGRRGATNQLLLNLTKSLNQIDDVNVHICCSADSSEIDKIRNLNFPLLEFGTESHSFHLIRNILRFPVFVFKYFTFVRRYKIDCSLTVMGNPFSAALSFVSHLLGCDHLSIRHETLSVENTLKSNLSVKFAKIEMAFSKWIICLSKDTAKRLSNHNLKYANKILGLFHPVYPISPARIRDLSNDDFNLLFFGRILPYKGLDKILAAWPTILNQIPSARLMVAGEGDCKRNPKFFEDNSIILKNYFISETELAEILNWADVILLPYERASQSGVIAASIVCGLPVICTKVGGLSEQVVNGETGIIIETNDPDLISEAVLSLYFSGGLLRKMSKASLDIAENKYSWSIFSRKILELINYDTR